GGVNSPVRAFTGLEMEPLIVLRGEGEKIFDSEGREWIDFCMSWGALLHGHAHREITEVAVERVKQGSTFGIATPVEEELAREVVNAFPAMEQVRFVSSGTEATMTAIRLARAATGRPLIIKFTGHYHGHVDSLLVKSGSGTLHFKGEASSEGVPKDVVKHTLSLPFNDQDKVAQIFRDPFYAPLIAAVIVEPVAANMGVVPPSPGFLKFLREETERIGALLIFDEVITGFRVAYGGMQTELGIEVDLTCLGKVVGGGFPAAAFGGKRTIMEKLAPLGGVYQAGTLSGNPVAMLAGKKALQLARHEGFYKTLSEKTERIVSPIRAALEEKNLPACIQHVPGLLTLFWGPKRVSSFEDLKELDKERFKAYFHFMFERGIYISPSPYEACFLSSAHTEEGMDRFVSGAREFIKKC
ncbi:MAG: glutamate-1-semialdehyde 2,1-aminomutase, partial [Chlamydiia bacterium]|nr:glutamate-1-semialdehyde 2,1-aminomutase [Chlamydiia bacterium]